MRAVRPIGEVVIVSRSEERGALLAKTAQDAGLLARLGDPGAVTEADIVCTCTTSTEPLFDGRMLPSGAHVNAVGAYLPTTREVDETTARRAAIVVETRDVALAEAGDLLIAFGGPLGAAAGIAADLSELVQGHRVEGEITLFESVGMAFEDLVVARAAVDAP
jgi:ornithine cyclodeaminase